MHIKWSISIRLLMSLYKRYFEKHDGAYIKASLYSCRPRDNLVVVRVGERIK